MINCSLCEKLFVQGDVFQIYLCYDCNLRTSFCLNCDKIMMKIFENKNIFKCGNCRKITPAILKELIEVMNPIDPIPNLNISPINKNIITPQKNIINNNRNDNNNSIFKNTPNQNKNNSEIVGKNFSFNSTSLNSPFLNETKNSVLFSKLNISPYDNNLEKQNNKSYNFPINNNINDQNNISNLTDINTDIKIKKKFHLVSDNNSKILVNNNKNIINYFLNDSKRKDKSDSDNENKNNFDGYNKKKKSEIISQGYNKNKI